MSSKVKAYSVISLSAALLLVILTLGSATAQGPGGGVDFEPGPAPPVSALPQAQIPVATPVPPPTGLGQPTAYTFNSETISLGSGRYHARIGIGPQYYQDADGAWHSVDPTLRLETKGTSAEYVSDRGLVHVRLPARLGAGAIRFSGTAHIPRPMAPAMPEHGDTMPVPASDPQACGSSDQPVAEGTLNACAPSEPRPTPPSDPPISRTAPLTVSGALSWTPLRLVFIDASGYQETVDQPAQVEGISQGNVLTYSHTLPGIMERFTVRPDGLKHDVILSSPEALPPTRLTGDLFLDYQGRITLSPGLAIYADGIRQDGDFTTASALELRGSGGEPVLYLPPVVAYEQANPLNRVRGRYSIRHASGNLLLSFGVPYAWLTDPQREYPVVIDPTVYIWPPAGDALIWSANPDNNWGSYPELWVGDAFRSVVVWDLSAVPERAMVYDSEAIFRLVANSGPDMDIAAHRLNGSWTEGEVTWNSRNGTDGWSTPGGDFDASPEDVVSVGTVTNTYPVWVFPDLVAEWHSGGRANYGILLQPESYPASAIKMFGSKESDGWKPELDVHYTLGPVELFPYTPFAWGVPSPDWYSFSRNSYWNAVAIRPPTGSDYDLRLSSTDEYADTLAWSTYGGDVIDFVLIDGNHAPSGDYYPSVTQFSRRGHYRIEYATHTADLSVGTAGPYTMTPNDVVRVWDVGLSSGTTYYLCVRPTEGDADLGIALHRSQAGDSATWYQGRGDSVAFAHHVGSGGGTCFSYTAPASDYYGLVILNSRATTDTPYMVYVDTSPPSGSFEIDGGDVYANSVNVTLNTSAADGETGMGDMRFQNGSPLNALVLQDSYPWGYDAIQQVLAANSIPYDQLGSSDIATVNLEPYSMVIIPSVQGDAFCNIYNSNLSKFENYVQSGGILELHGATYPSDACRPMLPGGGVNNDDLQSHNYVVAPSHPLMAGVPNPFYGTYASHNSFTGYPVNTTVLATAGSTPGGDATLIEYPLGSGKVIASGQTLEWGWYGDESAGKILANAISYAAGHMSWSTAVPWVLSPSDGVKTVYGEFRNNAGMWSPVYNDTIILDTLSPTASASCASETEETSFTVSWSGSDSLSGVASYDVQYRVGVGGAWTTWKHSTTATSATFGPTSPVTVRLHRTYYFRARARDRAGNTGQYAAGNGDCSIYVGGESFVYLPLAMRDYMPYFEGPWEREDNDSHLQANGPLRSGRAYYGYPDDAKDYFSIYLRTSGDITIDLTNHTGQGVQLQLFYQSVDNRVAYDSVPPYHIEYSGAAGLYYIYIWTDSGHNSTTPYTLRATFP